MNYAKSHQLLKDQDEGAALSPRIAPTAGSTPDTLNDTQDDDDRYAANEKQFADQDIPAVSDNHVKPPPLLVVPSNLPAGEPLQPSTTGATDHESYPEGGLKAWLVVLGCWFALVASLGLMNSVATFQSYLSTNQLSHYEADAVGWVFSIYTFVVFFMGVYIGPVFDKYGPRWIGE